MFSFGKAKIKRFNEEVGCAPPPTKYNPKSLSFTNGAAVTIDKSKRFQNQKHDVPGPGSYTVATNSSARKGTCGIMRQNSMSRIPRYKNSGQSSTEGAATQKEIDLDASSFSVLSDGSDHQFGVFASPPKLTRSCSVRLVPKSKKISRLNSEAELKMAELNEERNKLSQVHSVLLDALTNRNNKQQDEQVHQFQEDQQDCKTSAKDNLIVHENEFSALKYDVEQFTEKIADITMNTTFGSEADDLNPDFLMISGEKEQIKNSVISRSFITTNQDLKVTFERVAALQGERNSLHQMNEKLQAELATHNDCGQHIDHLNLVTQNLERSIRSKQVEVDKLKEMMFSRETELKEKEAVQMFLEKELTARDLELTEIMLRAGELEMKLTEERKSSAKSSEECESSDFEKCQLEAVLAAKDYDIEAKGDEIDALKIKLVSCEHDLTEWTIKCSEAMLIGEANQRSLAATQEDLGKERLVRQAIEGDNYRLRTSLAEVTAEKDVLEGSVRNLSDKYLNLEENFGKEQCYRKAVETLLSNVQLQLNNVEKELKACQTSSTGFLNQITQLKTDMRKKAMSVSEKQNCIDSLRDEKSVLEKHRLAIEAHVEKLEDQLAQTQCGKSQLQRQMQEERMTWVTSEGELRRDVERMEAEKKVVEGETNEKNLEINILKDRVCELELALEHLQTTVASQQDASVTNAEISSLSIRLNAATVKHVALKEEMEMLKLDNKLMNEEGEEWHRKFIELDAMVEPFREQLEAYEAERFQLVSSSSAAHAEANQLRSEYVNLIGHQNHKQKIQHMTKLKGDITKQKEEVLSLRQDNDRLRRQVRRFEEHQRLPGSALKTPMNKSSVRLDVLSTPAGKENTAGASVLRPSNGTARPHRM